MSSVIPVLRPQLPNARQILPYLERIDASRWYTNWGPLCLELEQRLAQLLGVDAAELVLLSNATAGLTLALRAQGIHANHSVAMPSWSFVATAAAATILGASPYFLDVDLDTWELSRETCLRATKTHTIDAVIPVAVFGAPINSGAWDSFAKETGIPVVIDAAASIDSLATRSEGFTPQDTPIVISLHATKVFGVGEGGLVVSKNRELIRRIRTYANFGFQGSRSASVDGYNFKISEYTAAVGLAELDGWSHKRAAWARVAEDYIRIAAEDASLGEVQLIPNHKPGQWISSYMHAQFKDSAQRDDAKARLDKNLIETRQWWNQGIHREPGYGKYPRTSMPNTDCIASVTLGLPCHTGLETTNIKKILTELRSC
jgi:dTDP-4-amino-4,6-dideoxygalactose transaminase